jgi:transcription elongation factor Elf1
MSREHRHYLRGEKASYDKQQTVLAPQGIEMNPREHAKMFSNPEYDKKVLCPFCLALAPMHKFLIKAKRGFNKGTGKCPECAQGMRLQTLMELLKWNAEQYAEWIFEYVSSGYWSKCTFDIWKKRLSSLGMSQRFWDRYHTLKGDLIEESDFNDRDYSENYSETDRH